MLSSAGVSHPLCIVPCFEPYAKYSVYTCLQFKMRYSLSCQRTRCCTSLVFIYWRLIITSASHYRRYTASFCARNMKIIKAVGYQVRRNHCHLIILILSVLFLFQSAPEMSLLNHLLRAFLQNFPTKTKC